LQRKNNADAIAIGLSVRAASHWNSGPSRLIAVGPTSEGVRPDCEHQRPGNVQQPSALVDPPNQDGREAQLFGQRFHGRACLVVIAGHEYDATAAILRWIAGLEAELTIELDSMFPMPPVVDCRFRKTDEV
jgi:hypothetical protein